MTPATRSNSNLTRRAFALSLVLTALAGCHKNVASAPPPPPSAPVYRASSPTPVRPRPVTPPPAIQPTPPDDPHGKPVFTEIGMASWYGPYGNRRAADGSVFDGQSMTAAHRTLPMGSTVRVTNLTTNQSVVVKITDRGPFVEGRTLDLSIAAAKAIGVYRMGVAKVKVEAFAKPGSDPEGRWCVQIGAFLDAADALSLKNELIGRYKTAKVIEFTGPTGHWVRINPATPDHDTAARIAASIHVPDATPYLIRTN